MCAPWVTRHTSIRYTSSCPTRVNMGASICFTAAMIRVFRSARSRGNSGTNTLHEMLVAQYNKLTHVIFQHIKRLLPGTAIFSLHTLASPSGRIVNYDEKQLSWGKKIEVFLLSVQVSQVRVLRFSYHKFLIPEYIMKSPVYTKKLHC
jgi:hypothetical protein